MAKVFGMHEIHLNPGVNTVEFERFIVEEVFPVYHPAGTTARLLK